MMFSRIFASALVVGTLIAAPVTAMSADQLQTRDRLHTQDQTADQLQTRDRLHTQDQAAAPATDAQSSARSGPVDRAEEGPYPEARSNAEVT